MSEETKRGRGRPKGSKGEQRLIKYTLNIGEAARDNIPAILILQFHTMRVAGINPKWILDKNNWPTGIEPDPSPHALAPTSTEKAESLKFITAYGWGQPVQSTQVDIDIRARIDQMGSGIPTAELQGGLDPRVLKSLQRLLMAPSDVIDETPTSDVLTKDVIDAEFVDVSVQPQPISDTTNENNPLPETGSGGSIPDSEL